jgi:hypothetical protein
VRGGGDKKRKPAVVCCDACVHMHAWCVCVCVCACLFASLCVRERESEGEREIGRERVCDRERGSERERERASNEFGLLSLSVDYAATGIRCEREKEREGVELTLCYLKPQDLLKKFETVLV